MDQENWLEHPNLKNMYQRKTVVIKNLMDDSKVKKMNECFPAIFTANNTLRNQGLYVHSQETSAMIDIMCANITQRED